MTVLELIIAAAVFFAIIGIGAIPVRRVHARHRMTSSEVVLRRSR